MPTLDMPDFARQVCGVPPKETTTVDELRAEWQRSVAVHEQAETDAEPYRRAASLAAETAYRLERQLLEAEGRGHTLRAQWLDAYLEHRLADCAAIIASEKYARELREGRTQP